MLSQISSGFYMFGERGAISIKFEIVASSFSLEESKIFCFGKG